MFHVRATHSEIHAHLLLCMCTAFFSVNDSVNDVGLPSDESLFHSDLLLYPL